MASARSAWLCPCDGLRQEAPEALGAVPFDAGRHDTARGMRWGQQHAHQRSTTAELYSHGDGNLGGDPALDASNCDGELEIWSIVPTLRPEESYEDNDSHRRSGCDVSSG